MATTWKAPTWRMPNEKNQSKFESYSLDFDGSSNYVDTGDAFTSLTSFSISAWFKSDDTSTAAQAIVSSRINSIGTSQGLDLNISGDVLYARVFNNGATEVTTAFTDTASWHHVAMIYNGTTLEMYLDGVSKGTATGVYTNSAANWVIGKWNNGANYFDGSISEVTIFDYALSSTQVSSLYNSGSPINPMTLKPAPIAYYPLGGNASTGGDSTNTLSVPNVAVPDASVFDFVPNDYINCGQNVVENSSNWTALTVSAWVKKDATGTYGRVIGKDDGGSNRVFLLQVQNNETLSGSIRTIGGGAWDNVVTAATIALGEWQHVAMTYLGNGTIKLYINGQQEATDTNTIANLNPVTTDTLIGAKGNISNMFEGEISNVQIWQAELSSTEITTLYNSGVPLLTGTQPQETNLKAWYKLNQSANWEADTASNWQIPDAVSSYPQSFDFDGSNDWIDCGNAFTETGAFTISAWINTSSSAAASVLYKNGVFQFGKDSWYNGGAGTAPYLSITDSNGLTKTFRNGVAASGSTVTVGTFIDLKDGNWHNITFTYNGTNQGKYYTDGVLTYTYDITDGAWAGTLASNSNSLFIGKTTVASWNGKISNVQIWNTTLPATGTDSVETLYNNGTPLTTAIATDNLKGWWKLDNTATFSTNWSVPDASGNGNTGTSSGMTEQNLVNNNVSALNGESSGMDTSNLVTSTLTRQVPYNSYSLNFDSASSDYVDTNVDLSSVTDITISLWANWNNFTDYQYAFMAGKKTGGNSAISISKWTGTGEIYTWDGTTSHQTGTSVVLNTWNNIVVTQTGTERKVYLNGALIGTFTAAALNLSNNNVIGRYYNASTTTANYYMNGKLSNVAIWNSSFTSTEILKLYNSGVPSNLSNFNPSPIAWWSLGSDSYYNGSNWICPDLISTNNGTSANMDDDALIGDAPNSTANGTATNMAIDANLASNAPNSSNNSFSVNMDSQDRETSVPG